ncbi:vacuolar protein sorting-associated protein 33B [Diprion similis]|uniref:vacuolar protein sorting-associated protein 33B n=1 Tax=Diprion similis TaxID=362088 RepID=UPI001EF8D0CB|nr:vacuolar protein sorting-associated protein 33B [Diprion similis]
MDITLDDRLDTLQQISQRKLVDILDNVSGKKDLIIEPKLMKTLECFIGVTALRRSGVDKIFKLEEGLKAANTQRLFLVSSDLIACKRVLNQIHAELSQSRGLSHHLLVVPRVPAALELLVEEEGLYELVKLRSLSWEFIRSDGNVLSLETRMYADLYYHRDTSLLPAIAKNLWSLHMIVGRPKVTLCFGKYSKIVLKMTESMEEWFSSQNPTSQSGCMILMDRAHDLPSALLTPVTYLGLMGEILEINAGTAYSKGSQTKLNPKTDHVYGEVRDRHFSDVFPYLRNKAKRLKSEQEATQTMQLAEMKRYVATKLPKVTEAKRQLGFHIAVCETIVGELGPDFEALQSVEKSILECRRRKECLEYIETNIDKHPLRSLRLLALLSVISDGVTQSEVKPIQAAYLHAHGYHNIPLFWKMEQAGLIVYRTDNVLQKLPKWSSEWATAAQKLKQLPNHAKPLDLKSPTCSSYVFGGSYIPTIAQLARLILNQETDAKCLNYLHSLSDFSLTGQQDAVQTGPVTICIIGGITYAEIAACRLIEQSTGSRFIFASDTTFTGNQLLESIKNI